MREIKFRAWDSEEKEMIFFELKDYQAIMGFIAYTGDFYTKLSIMQFTGLLDKDGKEGYEGDIVQIGDLTLRAVIEYEHGGFVMHHVSGSKRRHYCANGRSEAIFLNCDISVEVIGNIHENPELLEDHGEEKAQ